VVIKGEELVYGVKNLSERRQLGSRVRRVQIDKSDFDKKSFDLDYEPKYYRAIETVILNIEEITEEEWRDAGGFEALDDGPPF